mmetsp:Transcript_14224/g.30452  ORF Transcript_14224/g.30452 Transcript_14224/m.30452 type:complete len:258 (-) Transcript_14224:685-1458(-)|eukprot:CAMPEP_0118933678 /NCGR_PEP_ID=MMETSP1169-20130426/12125_1 /TAXON_ID=36882 /ORGANISM="Pyramimonas obovata, Strain CCMP722" /LENGTH=257 /DNA_ID=CAMNT_0006876471 /DNA_START=48 /DNA_END=821 /DNA_ORIENTATION=-
MANKLEEIQNTVVAKYEKFMDGKGVGVQVAAATLGGAGQGGFFGGMMGIMMKNQPPPPAGVTPPPQPASMLGGPWVIGRNVAVMTGVNAGLTLLMQRVRGVEDWKNGAAASFGAGFLYSVVSNVGAPKNLPVGTVIPTGAVAILADAARTGALFATLQTVFSKIGEHFSGAQKEEDTSYVATKQMLDALDLSKYEKNFKKGQLTDSTITLLTEQTLTEVKIPPGPRLLILNHVEQIKEYNKKYGKKNQAMSLALPVN